MSKFKDTILEAFSTDFAIDKLMHLIKPELIKQYPGLSVTNSGEVVIRLQDSQYVITLQPINIKTHEEEEFEEGEEQSTDQQNTIDPSILASLDTISKSTNPQLAASAKKTMSSLTNNINAIGTALVNKTNEMLNKTR